MKAILKQLIEYKTLTQEEAKCILASISSGKYSSAEIASFITIYMMRIITVEELLGFRNALYEQCLCVDFSDFNCIDLCGTGGDGKDTFNISTLASLVVAGAGYHVAKHGNYGLSSICGSSNVLEHLGYKFVNNASQLKKQLDTCHICFLHAPLFHPAMKAVALVRRELGVRTFFNVLGPLLNPASPPNQLVGVFSLEMARHYNYIYQQGTKNYCIIHALDGYDEISLTGQAKLINNQAERIVSPQDLGFDTLHASQIKGGNTIQEVAQLFLDILKVKGTEAQQAVVIANAAQAIQCINPSKEYEQCKEEAARSLHSQSAYQILKQLIHN